MVPAVSGFTIADTPGTYQSFPSAADVNPYKVDFTLPTLSAGVYDVEVYNGHGGMYAMSNWVQIWVTSNVPTQLYVPTLQGGVGGVFMVAATDGIINAEDVNTAITQAHTYWTDEGGANPLVADSYVTVQLPPGTMTLTGGISGTGAILMMSNVHLMGSGDSGSSETLIKGAGAGLNDLIDLSGIPDSAAAAASISNMYLFADTSLVSNAVIYDKEHDDGQTIDQLTIDDVTIDGCDSYDNVATAAAWDVWLHGPSSQTQYLNSTFIGEGLQVAIGLGMIVDNCLFKGCGEKPGTSMQIDANETGVNVSVSHSTDESLLDDRTSPGGDIDFDSATRFVDVQGTFGHVYVGDSTTIDLSEFPNAEAG
jgi:hypothetical protein